MKTYNSNWAQHDGIYHWVESGMFNCRNIKKMNNDMMVWGNLLPNATYRGRYNHWGILDALT